LGYTLRPGPGDHTNPIAVPYCLRCHRLFVTGEMSTKL
jgi:hypothetical protein